MTDNRDIDEILASLAALLREGDSHNDDMPVESASSVSDTDALEEALESDVESMESSLDDVLSNDEAGESSVTETVFDGVIGQQEEGMARVVLTEDMMVENPQVSLPLDFNAEVLSEDNVIEDESSAPEILSLDDVIANAVVQQDVVDNEPAMGEKSNNASSEHVANEHTEANPVMRLHKQEVDQLLTLVTEDVSNHLQQILPKLIKESLHARLADMQHDAKEAPNKS